MQQVANQCAIALRQSRLYQAAQAQVKELEKVNRNQLERVLAELLNNGCKYTQANGEIHFKAQVIVLAASTAKTVVQFTVSNEAEILETELSHIFEKFYRVPNADPCRQGGTGLGLALVQKLVSHVGGTIAVTSTQGWTTFSVQLPYSS